MLKTINKKNNDIYSKGNNRKAVIILNGFASPLTETNLVFDYFKKKNYTVARPKFHVQEGVGVSKNKCTPGEWFSETKSWISELSGEVDEIFIIGSSFGGNLGISCLVSASKKVKAFAAIEMPVIFSYKFWILSRIVQPIFSLLNVKQVKKNSIWYRGKKLKNLHEKQEFANVSVRLAGLIRDYVEKRTKPELPFVRTPILVIQSIESDVLGGSNAKYILKNLNSEIKEVYYIPLKNHDFTLLNEVGKVTMLERINKFFNSV